MYAASPARSSRAAVFTAEPLVSLGAAVVVELATEHPPAGLVLRSPFVDLASVAREHYPLLSVGLLLRDRYPTVDRIATVRAPTTVVYGTDRVS
jgi:uncharacterized protein